MIRSIALCLLLVVGATVPTFAAPRPLDVFAAASLQDALEAVARELSASQGLTLRLTFAATPALARQIEQGAPADVFVSADHAWMDHLQAAGRIDGGSRRDVVGNRLVVVAPRDASALATPSLAAAIGNGRIATAGVATVPAGRYARAALESSGLWTDARARLVETESVRAALLLVARGELPRGIVYASDAASEPRVAVLHVIDASAHPAIRYPAAVVAGSTHPQAAAFVAWLDGPAAATLFARHGFVAID